MLCMKIEAGKLFSLSGKRVVLTGAAGFFGRVFAEGLVSAGATVELIDISEDSLKNLSNDLTNTFGDECVRYHILDQDDHNKSREVFKSIIENGHVDGLVNNSFSFSPETGFNSPEGRLSTATYEHMKRSFDSGIYWAFQATQIFGENMKSQSGGSIVNVCSMYAVVVPSPDLYEGTEKFNPPGYSMSKGGLLQFTKYSASFLSPKVRVNAISPGAIPNLGGDSYNAITGNDPVLQRLHKKILLKRMGTPNDLVGSVIMLLAEGSSYITGQNIVIDGGLTVT